MLKDNLNITYSIICLLVLANVVGTIMYIGVSGFIVKLTTIHFTLLTPFLFVLISFTAFQSDQKFTDLAALFVIGLIGIFKASRPVFLIGFVL